MLKAPDLNRGRCIRIVNNLQETLKLIKKFNDGVMREFKEGEDESMAININSIIYEKISSNRKNKQNNDLNSVNYINLLKEDGKFKLNF